MNLYEYFNLVKDEIKKENINLLELKKTDIPKTISVHLEAINYMIYEWNNTNDKIRNDIFYYIIEPNIEKFNFSDISFHDIFDFLIKIKDKESEFINLN